LNETVILIQWAAFSLHILLIASKACFFSRQR